MTPLHPGDRPRAPGPPPRVPLQVRLALVLAASAAAACAGSLAAARSQAPLIVAALAGLGLALIAGALASRALLGRAIGLIRAVTDGLSSFAEADDTMRVRQGRRDEIGDLVERHNRLGDALRAQRDDLYQKELLLETALDAAPVAMVLHDEAGRVVYGNGAARAFFAAGERVGQRTLSSLLAGEPEELRAAIASGRDALVSVERNGELETLYVARRAFRLSTQAHVLVSVRSLTREISRREAELYRNAIRLISHELNNSLAPISSLLHSGRLLLDRPDQRERLGVVFDTIEERSAHLARFLAAYAELARLPPPAPERVAWRPFLERMRGLAPFTLRGAPEEPGFFDPAQIQQLLLNLLKNAAEAGSPPDRIEVSVRRLPTGELALTVADRGEGLADEALGKALLPLYSTKQQGRGLGLALCREIAIAHGGALALRRRDGGGAEVECRLPPPPDERAT
ncbi:sensor histidine kinase [Sorangium sp. So ce542]|uniref:sensor histidine kinase n=1 Tax=Sorangium sp. So ce542 TaxID=3133316 RepID=UPI003F63F6A9